MARKHASRSQSVTSAEGSEVSFCPCGFSRWRIRPSGSQYPERFDAGSPIELLPSGSRQILIHGTEDDIVPFSQSEKFVERAEQLGEQPTLVKLEGVGHFELIDPESDAWSKVVTAVLPVLGM